MMVYLRELRREKGRENVLVVSCWLFVFQVFRSRMYNCTVVSLWSCVCSHSTFSVLLKDISRISLDFFSRNTRLEIPS